MIGGDGPMNENVGTRLSTEVTISGKTKNVKKLRYAEYYNNQEQYDNLYDKEENVIFGGRLAEYKYYDMAPIIEKVMERF